MWQAWVNVVIGVWSIISSFSAGLVTSSNFIFIGIFVAIFGFWTPYNKWQGYVNGILGLWLFVSSFIPVLTVPVNLLLTGLAITILALWSEFSATPQYPRAQASH